MIHYLFRAAILISYALLIVYLFQTGEIGLYIAPRMELLVKLSAIGLYAAAAYQIYAAIQLKIHKHTADCECGHGPSSSPFKNIIAYGLFIMPLLLGFLLPTGTLGSALAEKKGMSFNGSQQVSRAANDNLVENEKSLDLEKLFPFDEYTVGHADYGKKLYEQPLISIPEEQFIETLTTLDLYRDAFIGKEIEISGFVYREEEMDKTQIAVSRFAMNCCSADALPYGLMIIWPKANEYNKDEWVSVKGKLTISMYMDNVIIALEATRITRIPAPESPYVYPDLSFGL